LPFVSVSHPVSEKGTRNLWIRNFSCFCGRKKSCPANLRPLLTVSVDNNMSENEAGIKEEEESTDQTKATAIVEKNDDENAQATTIKNDDGNASPLLPVAPSHILATGQYIHLPKPTPAEHSSFFQRAITTHQLVSADKHKQARLEEEKKEKGSQAKKNSETKTISAFDKSDGDTGTHSEPSTANLEQQAQDASATREKAIGDLDADNNKDKDDDVATKIHPLAIASARVDGVGVAELSKAINLGTLVASNEYFGWANIVSQEGLEAIAAATTAMETTKQQQQSNNSDNKTDASHGAGGDASASKSDTASGELVPNAPSAERLVRQALDSNLRAAYLLKRKHSALHDASLFLEKHQRRLSSSVAKQRLVDRRYIQLRHRWRLVAPEHGTRVSGPVRSEEVVAVDVETYDRDRVGGGNNAAASSGGLLGDLSGGGGDSTKRRLARMVPRYATIELQLAEQTGVDDEDDDNKTKGATKAEADDSNRGSQMDVDTTKSDAMSVDSVPQNGDAIAKEKKRETSKTGTAKEQPSSAQIIQELSKKLYLQTKAEPYAVADPTLGKLDLDFDPAKVPVWTLLLSVTKTSTGYTASSTLSSLSNDDDFLSMEQGTADKTQAHPIDAVVNITMNENGDTSATDGGVHEQETPLKRKKTKDECVIQSLQHSLFCASLFDVIRHEITTAHAGSTATGSTSSSAAAAANGTNNSSSSPARVSNKGKKTSTKAPVHQASKTRATVWISSEVNETYLPPPLLMASGRDHASTTTGFCVIYCQEGEVKVQLNPEYALTIKLIELGTATGTAAELWDASSSKKDANKKDSSAGILEKQKSDEKACGSQTPEALQILCRSLLLHAQFIYHDFRTTIAAKETGKLTVGNKDAVQKQYAGHLTTSSPLLLKKESTCARILEHCVGFGAKVLLEGKIRGVLKVRNTTLSI
jgi:hypothetical protein